MDDYPYLYTKEDLNRAFDTALENAIIVLEKSVGLTEDGQLFLIKQLKQMVEQGKIKFSEDRRYPRGN